MWTRKVFAMHELSIAAEGYIIPAVITLTVELRAIGVVVEGTGEFHGCVHGFVYVLTYSFVAQQFDYTLPSLVRGVTCPIAPVKTVATERKITFLH